MVVGERLICCNCGSSLERGEQFRTTVRWDSERAVHEPQHVCGVCDEYTERYWRRCQEMIRTRDERLRQLWG